MNLESLSNELLLDILEYFDIIRGFRIFHGLNSRFDNLLFTHLRNYRLDFRSVSKHNFQVIYEQYLPSIINQVIALHLSDDDETPNLPEIFLSYDFTLDRFDYLQSLSLFPFQSIKLINQLIIGCRYLLYLTHFAVIKYDVRCTEKGLCFLLDNIWRLPMITHCNLDSLSLHSMSLKDTIVVSSLMEHLSIGSIDFESHILFDLFKCTPNLQRCCTTANSDTTEYMEYAFCGHDVTISSLFESSHSSLKLLTNRSFEMASLSHVTVETSIVFLNGLE
jgi:hypothetical protein